MISSLRELNGVHRRVYALDVHWMPSRAELEIALEDADREGAPMDLIELAREFGISREEAEMILEGGI